MAFQYRIVSINEYVVGTASVQMLMRFDGSGRYLTVHFDCPIVSQRWFKNELDLKTSPVYRLLVEAATEARSFYLRAIARPGPFTCDPVLFGDRLRSWRAVKEYVHTLTRPRHIDAEFPRCTPRAHRLLLCDCQEPYDPSDLISNDLPDDFFHND